MQRITACRVCGSADIRPFFDLGKQPFANSLLKTVNEKEAAYPLSLSWCGECNLVQLNETADPGELFSDYVWVTGTSAVARKYADSFYASLVAFAGEKKYGYVLELASNDGTFLLPFLKNGYKVLGVDPARNIAEVAEKAGVPTMCEFFGKETVQKLLAERGPARIVFARNVLPHVANTHEFVEGMSKVIDNDGAAAIEFHYAKPILEELHYDSIYHEHLCYFTLKPLEQLLNVHGLFICDVGESPINSAKGGNLVLYLKKRREETSAVAAYKKKEEEDKTNELASWEKFSSSSFAHRDAFLAALNEARKDGSVVGWGASARSSTLLNFCGINADIISVIADSNPLKQKRFTAGSHILIDSPDFVMKKNPRHVVILAWNFADEIMKTLKEKYNYAGDCIIPLPRMPKVVNMN